METTSLERENLEAHVDLCQQRYVEFDKRLESIEQKVCRVHEDIIKGNKSTTRAVIAAAGTVIGGLLSTVVVVLIAFL